MKQIWKFLLGGSTTILLLPEDAQILTVQMQRDFPCLWALVTPDLLNGRKHRTFVVYGTGHNILNSEYLKYIGTYQMHEGALVFHVFEDQTK